MDRTQHFEAAQLDGSVSIWRDWGSQSLHYLGNLATGVCSGDTGGPWLTTALSHGLLDCETSLSLRLD
jgi:hypothetical protein